MRRQPLASLSVLPAPQPQVTADWSTSISDAIDRGDEAAMELEKASWQAKARAFWAEHSGNKIPAPKAAERRRKAHLWLLATDRAMQVTSGRGWGAFVVDERREALDLPEHWPVAHVALDQGSDGWAAIMWVAFASRVCVHFYRDPLHRLWNDVLASVKSAGLWPLCLLMTVALGMDCGPFEDARWFQECREAVSQYCAVADTSRPVFNQFYGELAREQGLAENMGDPSVQAQVFRGLAGAFERKGGNCCSASSAFCRSGTAGVEPGPHRHLARQALAANAW